MSTTTAKPRPLPSPLYGAVVVALAVFFVGLIIWRSPIQGYLVMAEVTAPKSVDESDSAAKRSDRRSAPELSLQQIANAVRAAECQVNDTDIDAAGVALTPQRLGEISQNIKVEVNSDSGINGWFRLSFLGDDLPRSLAVVDHLVHQISFDRSKVSPRGAPTSSAVRRAKWLLAQSRHYERKARFDMEDALNVHFDLLRDPSGLTQRPSMDSDYGDSAQTVTNSPIKVAGTSVNGDSWGSQPVSFASTDEPVADFRAALFAESADYRELRKQYEVAIQQREAAEQQFSQLVALQHAAAQESPVAATGVIHPAALVRQIGGRPSRSSVLVIGLLALGSGTLVFWRTSRLRGLAQINSVDELQAAIPVPLVGQISIDPMASQLRRRASGGVSVRWCTQAGELVLALMIALFLLSILSDSPAAKELADNPLGTFVHRVAKASGL